MIKAEILTDTTIAGLQRKITEWLNIGWRLHEGIVITQREDMKGPGLQGQTVIHSSACGFLQIMTRTEGCKVPQSPTESI